MTIIEIEKKTHGPITFYKWLAMVRDANGNLKTIGNGTAPKFGTASIAASECAIDYDEKGNQ